MPKVTSGLQKKSQVQSNSSVRTHKPLGALYGEVCDAVMIAAQDRGGVGAERSCVRVG
jgi:hypothetical protein